VSKIFKDRKLARRFPDGGVCNRDEAEEINVYCLHEFGGGFRAIGLLFSILLHKKSTKRRIKT